MNKEIEKKFEVLDKLNHLETALKTLGLKYIGKEQQKDIYWDTKDFKIINLKRGLRLRNNKILEFKSLFKKNDGSYVVEEILIGKHSLNLDGLKKILVERLSICSKHTFKYLDSSSNAQSVLTKLGLFPVLTLEKTRKMFENDSLFVSVDYIVGYPLYLEVELKDNKKNEKAINLFIRKLQTRINLKPTLKGYLDIVFSKHPKILLPEEFERRFKQNTNWNILPSERVIVNSLIDED